MKLLTINRISLGLVIYLFLSGVDSVLNAQSESISYNEGIALCNEKYKRLKEKLKGRTFVRVGPSCLEGYVLPEIEVVDVNKKVWNNDSLKGKLNVINFWFTTCNACIVEMPYLNRIRKEISTEKVNFLAIARDNKENVEKFIDNNLFEFSIIPGGAELIDSTFQFLWGYPLTLITDENLVIVKAITGASSEKALRQTIIPLLTN